MPMITAREFIKLAKNSELKQLAIANDEEAVLGYINLGLLELYKRLPVKTKEHIIDLEDGVDEYEMPEDFLWIVAAYAEPSPEYDCDAIGDIKVKLVQYMV